jgi:hypothetical protein
MMIGDAKRSAPYVIQVVRSLYSLMLGNTSRLMQHTKNGYVKTISAKSFMKDALSG